jgi:hypothetical protein
MNAIYILPYYDSINKNYRDIITINTKPDSELNELVKQINYKSPSSYTDYNNNTNNCCNNDCIYAFKSLCNKNELMCVDEIPKLFNELTLLGYSINTQITDMMSRNNIKQNNKKLLCYITAIFSGYINS